LQFVTTVASVFTFWICISVNPHNIYIWWLRWLQSIDFQLLRILWAYRLCQQCKWGLCSSGCDTTLHSEKQTPIENFVEWCPYPKTFLIRNAEPSYVCVCVYVWSSLSFWRLWAVLVGKVTLSECQVVSCEKAGTFQKMTQCIMNAYFMPRHLCDKFSLSLFFVMQIY
jgi:hypothetical protein